MRDATGGWGDAELAAPGRIAASFAQLDWQAGRLLAGFIRPRDVAIVVTVGEDLRWTLDKLSVITAETLEDPLASLALLDRVKAARIAADRRNQLTHSFYLPPAGEQPLARMRASTRGGTWKGQSEPVGLADLSEVGELLAEGARGCRPARRAPGVLSAMAGSDRSAGLALFPTGTESAA